MPLLTLDERKDKIEKVRFASKKSRQKLLALGWTENDLMLYKYHANLTKLEQEYEAERSLAFDLHRIYKHKGRIIDVVNETNVNFKSIKRLFDHFGLDYEMQDTIKNLHKGRRYKQKGCSNSSCIDEKLTIRHKIKPVTKWVKCQCGKGQRREQDEDCTYCAFISNMAMIGVKIDSITPSFARNEYC